MVQRYGKRNRYGSRYVARDAKGQIISNVDVGRSLSQDRRRKAIREVDPGFGGLGDAKRAEFAAQGYDDRLDESLGMSRRGSKIRQSYKDRRDESKGMEKARGRRAYSRVGTMDKNADYFTNAAGAFYPTGDGRVLGSITTDAEYAPLAAAEGDVKSGFKMGLGATLGIIGGLVVAGSLGNLLSSFKKPSDE